MATETRSLARRSDRRDNANSRPLITISGSKDRLGDESHRAFFFSPARGYRCTIPDHRQAYRYITNAEIELLEQVAADARDKGYWRSKDFDELLETLKNRGPMIEP